MCDQTEVTYSAGDVVWVKLGPVWWPGQVQDYEKLPEEITSDLRKKPIAVVKFFQEETFEYVRNLSQIYHYNCRKKEEFIKKGLDMVRSSNSRDVPSNMKMFPNDIVMAEHLTGGNPNILNDDSFAPEQKSDYSDLFGTKKSSGKKLKGELKRDPDSKSRRHSSSPVTNNRRSLPALPSTVPRLITHPRFISKALDGRSDHEVRIRCQLSIQRYDEEIPAEEKKYNCHLCDFESRRLNVIVLHNKSHSASFIEAQNANKARLKAKERDLTPPTLNLLVEQTTPTLVTSRGRVKSLPKKLLDYSDEPPPKISKERVYSKSTTKEETCEAPKIEKTPIKIPKKVKDNADKSPIKRPLFGKRKTAKEKAEMAAKQKQENEAMKETLLKDWDDDDVNEEEVELERLKQALESTTTSNPEFDDKIEETVPEVCIAKTEEKPSISDDIKIETKSDVSSKVFEFDDSEDGLPVNISFRLKNQREKFTDDKFKKPKPPKPLSKMSPKPKILPISQSLISEKKEIDKETAKFNEAFNALLEETVVPALPEIPKSCFSISSTSLPFSDQTSDISSSTDLLGISDNTGVSDELISNNLVVSIVDSEILLEDIKMECTSSDSEEMKITESIQLDKLEETRAKDEQKHLKEVSTSDPSVEIDSELSPGVATTSDSLNVEEKGENKDLDSTITEISSTCDVSKILNEESKLKALIKEEIIVEENIVLDTDSGNASGLPVITSDEVNVETDRNQYELDTNSCKSEHFAMTSTDDSTKIETEQEPCKEISECLQNYTKSSVDTDSNAPDVEMINYDGPNTIEQNNVQESSQSVELEPLNVEFNPEKLPVSNVESGAKGTGEPLSMEAEVVKEEIVVQQIAMEAEQEITEQVIDTPQRLQPSENVMNVQLLLPSATEPDTLQIHHSPLHQQSAETVRSVIPKQGTSNSIKIENQVISQSLQDMELDINSMPVIIGGEDFIQPEQPKQNLLPVQPKYSENIVISPKASTSSGSNPEGVIMQLGEPSTSKQSVQPILAVPNKSGRGGRSQKTSSKTIKLSASALKNLGTLQKGGNQQVLILKTTSSQDKEKGAIHKTKGPLNMFQHGNKILIVNNPQITGQNKIKLNPQQQQLLTGGKLAPGTRVYTSKVVATTSQASASPNKTSTARSSAKSAQKIVISKSGILTNTSKSVIINNNSGKLMTTVPGTHTVTTSKGQTLITHNILTTKGGLILPSTSQPTSSGNKTATYITSQALSTSKGMILTPISSKGGTILSGNQKLRIVSSKAPLSGTKLVVQNAQGKLALDGQHKGQQLKLISGLRGQSPGNTILIQTSQGIVAKSIGPSTTTTAGSQQTLRTTALAKTVMTTIPTQAKIRVTSAPVHQHQIIQCPPIVQHPQTAQPTQLVQQTQIVQQPQIVQPSPSPPVKKVTVQKVRQSPNILQKTQRKSTPRGSKAAGNRLTSPAASKTASNNAPEPILLSTTSSLPVISQQPTLVQGQVPQGSENLVYLTVDEAGNYRQLDNKSLITFEGNAETPRTIFIPADTRPQDVGNIFLAIDDAGNIVNISQPAVSTSYTAENAAPSQDILAKALANTQVLQQETIIPDIDVSAALSSSMDSSVLSSSSFSEQVHYPAPSLSHSVLETSLTLNQPIMTPLEVPSSVATNLGQIPSLSSSYITSNMLSPKQKHIRPSMPLLTEEAMSNQTNAEPVFLLDNSNNIIPTSSGSQISFQLTIDENNVIMASGPSGAVLPPTYQVVSSEMLTPQLLSSEGSQSLQKIDNLSSETIENPEKFDSTESVSFNMVPERGQEAQTTQHSIILREALEAPQASMRGDHTDIPQNDSFTGSHEVSEELVEIQTDVDPQSNERDDSQLADNHPVSFEESYKTQDEDATEITHSLKRRLGEEQAVTSSSDLEESSKRMRIEER